MTVAINDFSSPDALIDSDEQQELLIRLLHEANGFQLIFAVANTASERHRRMDAIEARIGTEKRIQRIMVGGETENLLRHLRDILTDPKPDILFIYGLENGLSGTTSPISLPFLRNLNFTTDSFPLLFPTPMVLWVPQYAQKMIADTAPDFYSARTDVYRFPFSERERDEIAIALRIRQTETGERTSQERVALIHDLQEILAEYHSLPESQRPHRSESYLLNSLALRLMDEGSYTIAKHFIQEAITIDRKLLPDNHPILATRLNNQGDLYTSQKQYVEAAHSYREALAINRKSLPGNHPNLATTLNNLAMAYLMIGRGNEALPLCEEAVKIMRASMGDQHPDTIRIIEDYNLCLVGISSTG